MGFLWFLWNSYDFPCRGHSLTTSTLYSFRFPGLQVDIRLSRNLSERLRAENSHCYKNAAQGLLLLRQGSYVEGYVIVPEFPFPVPHAWIAKNYRVVDPTPRYAEDPALYYEPGLVVTYTELCAALSGQSLQLPLMHHLHPFAQPKAAYRAAKQAAWAHLAGLSPL